MGSFLDVAKRAKWIGIFLLAAAVMFASPSAFAQESDADTREIRNYRLTMDKIKKVDQALQALVKDPAVRAAIRKKAAEQQKQDEEREEEESQTIDNAVRKMESLHPAVRSSFQSAGITPREYLVLSFAWAQAAFVVEMRKGGAIQEIPPEVSKENVAFVEANAKELQAVADRWKKLTADLGLNQQSEE